MFKCWGSSQDPPEELFPYPTTLERELQGEMPKNFRPGESATRAKGASRGFRELRTLTLFSSSLK